MDSYRRTRLQGSHRRKFSSAPDTKDNARCGILPLSIGMKIVLTLNICTNDGLANGAQGILQQIVYNEEFVDKSSASTRRSYYAEKAPKVCRY